MSNPSTPHDGDLAELEAALIRWRALLFLGDLQRRAYRQQAGEVVEPPGEGERLYRKFALRMAAENQQLRARIAELEQPEET